MQLNARARIRIPLFVLILCFLVLSHAGVALAAVITINDIRGGDVVSNNAGSGGAWSAEAYYYPAPLKTVMTIDATGDGFPNQLSVTWTVDETISGTTWTESPTTSSVNDFNRTNARVAIKGNAPSDGSTLAMRIRGTSSDPTGTNASLFFDLTFREGRLQPVLSRDTLNLITGNTVTETVSVGSFTTKGGESSDAISISTLAVRYNNAEVTSWNGLTINADPASKTITFTGTPTTDDSRTFDVVVGSSGAKFETASVTVNTTAGAPGPSSGTLSLSSSNIYLYLENGAVSTSVTITDDNLAISSLSVAPDTWNGLTLAADAAAKRITVIGTPQAAGEETINITCVNSDGETLTGSFRIVVRSLDDIKALSEDKIGIWDHGNANMHYSEMKYYNGRSENTGYNSGGKYDVLFFAGEVLDGSYIRVYLRDPGDDDTFHELPRLRISDIPLESWYYVNKNPGEDIYSRRASAADAAPEAGTAPAKGTGTSFGWYRADVSSGSGMTLAINSMPAATGEYTFCIYYAPEGLIESGSLTSTTRIMQEFTLRCTDPVNSSGGGCGTGVGAMGAFVLSAVLGMAAVRRKGR